MKISRIKNSITTLFLVLFLLMKLTGLHAMTHSDDDKEHETCAICDHAIVHNLTPTISPDLNDFSIENTEIVFQREITSNYSYIAPNTIIARVVFSRPPPFFL